MHQKLYDLDGSDLSWDYDTMHIRCFCHKMALVVNAGLNELGLESPPPPKLKKSFLGSVPYSNKLKPIMEEDEEEDGVDESASDCDIDTDDVDEDEEDMDEDDDELDTGKTKYNHDEEDGGENDDDSNYETSQQSNKKRMYAINRNESNKLHELTQNVCFFILVIFGLLKLTTSIPQLDFVVKKITGSAAWRQEFKRRADAIKDQKLEPLIAGYGIRWNIKYEIRRRAYKARDVSHSLKKHNFSIIDIIKLGYRCNAP